MLGSFVCLDQLEQRRIPTRTGPYIFNNVIDGKLAQRPDGKDADADEKREAMIRDDYTLYEALNLLKGIAILQQRMQ